MNYEPFLVKRLLLLFTLSRPHTSFSSFLWDRGHASVIGHIKYFKCILEFKERPDCGGGQNYITFPLNVFKEDSKALRVNFTSCREMLLIGWRPWTHNWRCADISVYFCVFVFHLVCLLRSVLKFTLVSFLLLLKLWICI